MIGKQAARGSAMVLAQVVLTVIVVLAGAAGADPASAAVAPSAKVPAAAAGQARMPTRVGTLAASAEPHGHERLHLWTHSPTSRRQRLRATGVLDASGHAYAGRIIAGRVRNWLVVPHGAIRLITIVTAISVTPPSRTCRFTETYGGSYQIRGGASRYASARGYGTYGTKIVGRLARKHGRCTSAIAYFSQSTVTSGSLRW